MKAETIQLNGDNAIKFIAGRASLAFTDFTIGRKQKLEVVIQNAKSARSIRQNSLIHALFGDISIEAASVGSGEFFTPAQWKEFFKAQFLEQNTIMLHGQEVHTPKSTAKLTKKECGEFVTSILFWCHDRCIDVNIKTKDDYYFLMGGK